MNRELLSIILPVKNAENYICECIESILNQTYENFELLIFNDQSNDNTITKIESFKDNRIKLFHNKGFIANLNAGFNESIGKYIFRMDADDVMMKDRLKIQYEILSKDEDLIVCSSSVKLIDGNGNIIREKSSVQGDIKNILIRLCLGNFIYHPSVAIRKSFLIKNKIFYKKKYLLAEDYKLWFDIAKRGGSFYNVDSFLLNYRISDFQASKMKAEKMQQCSNMVREEVIRFVLQRYSFDDIELHRNLYEILKQHEQIGALNKRLLNNIMGYILAPYL